ncbi:hypothetical protein TCDM_10911 [Trypanosoma cruzi Dm28c]|uniref:Uncharacterized protein n=1 Tax=Trypanosoma cruzi Dm28c TaxID=1416333 RepID=V5D215_TRYCR|nr:hypothetical protein TCDM_10911 [Trypanosoma cruzi Dm28c]
MCGHTEGQTVERHVNIFLILFFGQNMYRQFLEQHGGWVLFVCVCDFSFSFPFFYSGVAVIEDDFFLFFLS